MVFRYLSLFLLYINIKIGKNRCLMLDWPVSTCMRNSFYLAVTGGVFDGVFLCCHFSPLDVLDDEIWDVIESVSERFFFLPTLTSKYWLGVWSLVH